MAFNFLNLLCFLKEEDTPFIPPLPKAVFLSVYNSQCFVFTEGGMTVFTEISEEMLHKIGLGEPDFHPRPLLPNSL